jgi:hypothetical protein
VVGHRVSLADAEVVGPGRQLHSGPQVGVQEARQVLVVGSRRAPAVGRGRPVDVVILEDLVVAGELDRGVHVLPEVQVVGDVVRRVVYPSVDGDDDVGRRRRRRRRRIWRRRGWRRRRGGRTRRRRGRRRRGRRRRGRIWRRRGWRRRVSAAPAQIAARRSAIPSRRKVCVVHEL